MRVSISIFVWIGRRVEVPRRLFGDTGRREDGLVARRKLPSPGCRRHRRFVCSLRQVRTVFEANDFRDSLAKHGECGDQQPKPPDSSCRSERKNCKGDEQEAQPHKGLGNSVGQSGWARGLQVAVAVPPPSRTGFGQATSQRLRHKAQVASARAAELRLVTVFGCALWAVHRSPRLVCSKDKLLRKRFPIASVSFAEVLVRIVRDMPYLSSR
jgi:hypothetical protein